MLHMLLSLAFAFGLAVACPGNPGPPGVTHHYGGQVDHPTGAEHIDYAAVLLDQDKPVYVPPTGEVAVTKYGLHVADVSGPGWQRIACVNAEGTGAQHCLYAKVPAGPSTDTFSFWLFVFAVCAFIAWVLTTVFCAVCALAQLGVDSVRFCIRRRVRPTPD